MVSNLPISSPYRSTPNAPVTDATREQLNVRLNAAYTAGSLDEDEYQGRLNVLFAAQRMGELLPVVEGLPPLQTYNSPSMVASTGGQPGEVSVSRNAGGVSLLAVGGVAALIILVAILFLVLVP